MDDFKVGLAVDKSVSAYLFASCVDVCLFVPVGFYQSWCDVVCSASGQVCVRVCLSVFGILIVCVCVCSNVSLNAPIPHVLAPYVGSALRPTHRLVCLCFLICAASFTGSRHWDRRLNFTISDCVFRGNTAGAVAGSGLTGSATGVGGALYLSAGGDIVLQDSVFEGNAAAASGGGAFSTSLYPMPLRPPNVRCSVTCLPHAANTSTDSTLQHAPYTGFHPTVFTAH